MSKDKDGDSRRERKRKEEEVERSLTVFTKSPYGIISRQEVSIDTDKPDLDEEIFRSNTYHFVVTDEDGKDILSVGGNSVVRIDKSTGKVTASGTYANTTNGELTLIGFCCEEMYVNPITKEMGISHGDIFSVKGKNKNILVMNGKFSRNRGDNFSPDGNFSCEGDYIKFRHRYYPMNITVSGGKFEYKLPLDFIAYGYGTITHHFYGDAIVFKRDQTTISVTGGEAEINLRDDRTNLDGKSIILKCSNYGIRVSARSDARAEISHRVPKIHIWSEGSVSCKVDRYCFSDLGEAYINCYSGSLHCPSTKEFYPLPQLRALEVPLGIPY